MLTRRLCLWGVRALRTLLLALLLLQEEGAGEDEEVVVVKEVRAFDVGNQQLSNERAGCHVGFSQRGNRAGVLIARVPLPVISHTQGSDKEGDEDASENESEEEMEDGHLSLRMVRISPGRAPAQEDEASCWLHDRVRLLQPCHDGARTPRPLARRRPRRKRTCSRARRLPAQRRRVSRRSDVERPRRSRRLRSHPAPPLQQLSAATARAGPGV